MRICKNQQERVWKPFRKHLHFYNPIELSDYQQISALMILQYPLIIVDSPHIDHIDRVQRLAATMMVRTHFFNAALEIAYPEMLQICLPISVVLLR
jgi:hypothetical protein